MITFMITITRVYKLYVCSYCPAIIPSTKLPLWGSGSRETLNGSIMEHAFIRAAPDQTRNPRPLNHNASAHSEVFEESVRTAETLNFDATLYPLLVPLWLQSTVQ